MSVATGSGTRIPPEYGATELTRIGLSRPLTHNQAVAKAFTIVCWLLDGVQAWITGQVIGVDGGLGSVQAKA